MSKKKQPRPAPARLSKARVKKALKALSAEELRFFPKTDSMSETSETPWVSQREQGQGKAKLACRDGDPAHSGIL